MQSRAAMARATAPRAIRNSARSAWVCSPCLESRQFHVARTPFALPFGTMRPVSGIELVDGVRAANLSRNGIRCISHTGVAHSREEKQTTATDIQEELQQRAGGVREEKNLEDGLPKFDFSSAPPTLPPKGTEQHVDSRQRSELLNAAVQVNFGTSAAESHEQESPAAEQPSEFALPKFNFSDAAPTTTQYMEQNTRSSLLSAAKQVNYGADTEQPSPAADHQEAGGLPNFQYSEADSSSPKSENASTGREEEEEWDYSPEASMRRFIAAQNPNGERGVPDYEYGQQEMAERIESAQAKAAPPQPAERDAFASALLRVDTLEEQGLLGANQAEELRWLCLWEAAPMRVLQRAYPEDDRSFLQRSVSLLEQVLNGKQPPGAK